MLKPKEKEMFRREGAEAERACGAARLRPDWLTYDRARELKHRFDRCWVNAP